jgi:LemA protein
MEILYVLLAIALAIGAYVVVTYNGLVSLSRRTEEAWSDIQVQMKRRYDLIPNLIETVKGYMGHERATLEAVTRARAAALSDQGSPGHQAASENMLQQALKSLFAVAEAYPDLKANTSFLELQRELAETENLIQRSRRFYNGNVRDLNIKIDQFPSNLVAAQFAFSRAEFFELEASEAASASQPVRVSFP